MERVRDGRKQKQNQWKYAKTFGAHAHLRLLLAFATIEGVASSATPDASCNPDIVTLGMARSGTSELRRELARFVGVDAGKKSEFWAIGNHVNGSKHLVRPDRNYQHCGCGVQRVASAPWLFALPAEEVNAHVRVHTQRSPCPVTFVLLLRHPVERLISSFYHMGTDFMRTKDARAFAEWANSSDRCRRWPIPEGEGGHYNLASRKKQRYNYGYFYTTDMMGAYSKAVAATVGHRLVVGFTSKLGETVKELQRLFGWTPCDARHEPSNHGNRHTNSTCNTHGVRFKARHRNSAPRARHWPELEAAAAAVAECEVEQIRFVSQLQAYANGTTATMPAAAPAHVVFAGRRMRGDAPAH